MQIFAIDSDTICPRWGFEWVIMQAFLGSSYKLRVEIEVLVLYPPVSLYTFLFQICQVESGKLMTCPTPNITRALVLITGRSKRSLWSGYQREFLHHRIRRQE